MSPYIRLKTYDELLARVQAILERNGCATHVAGLVARNCVAAERDGASSHGLFRLPGYVSSLRSGWVDGAASPRIERAAPAFLRVDGMNGFTLAALDAARFDAMTAARQNGAAVLAIRNSHHLGVLSLDVEPFAEEGLFALSVINSMKSVAPFDARCAVFGTNPIAYAAPRADGPPLVVDLATSSMAHGDVQLAAREQRTLPTGTGIDGQGAATTNPQAVLDGALLTFGGYKGSAIAMLVELLCAALGGGKFSHEVDLAQHPGAATPHTGQTFVLIDPEAAGHGTMTPFAERVEMLLAAMTDAGVSRLPGERRLCGRSRAAREGIPVSEATLRLLDNFEAE